MGREAFWPTGILRALTMHTRKRARGKGKRNPDKMLKKMLPGIAKVCRLELAQEKVSL